MEYQMQPKLMWKSSDKFSIWMVKIANVYLIEIEFSCVNETIHVFHLQRSSSPEKCTRIRVQRCKFNVELQLQLLTLCSIEFPVDNDNLFSLRLSFSHKVYHYCSSGVIVLIRFSLGLWMTIGTIKSMRFIRHRYHEHHHWLSFVIEYATHCEVTLMGQCESWHFRWLMGHFRLTTVSQRRYQCKR